jgi:eukaryotic-like serine/threonine-protein kinase
MARALRDNDVSFQIDVNDDGRGRCVVRVYGVIDENADLTPLTSLRAPRVQVNMGEVRRINSFGVRSWIEALRKVPESVSLEFVECPPPVIDQCNMVRGFLGHGRPSSFYAMMVCGACDEELDKLYSTEECKALGGKLPLTSCPSCGGEMEVDDIEEQYLSFLKEP